MICFGHRGAKGYEPENTILSIKKALSLGVQGIEIDIHAVHGELLVIHDSWILHEGKKTPLEKISRDKLAKIDVGKGERIPTLREVLDVVSGSVILNIEMKGVGCVPLLVNEITRARKESAYPTATLLVSSFHHEELLAFHRLMPEIPCGLLVYGVPLRIAEDAKACGCSSVHLHIESASSSLVSLLKNEGFKVYVYTVNSPEEIACMRESGVDGIFSDYPDRCVKG